LSGATPRGPTLCLRAGVAFIWLATGLAVLHPEYRREGAAALAPLGLPPWVMVVTCAGEVLLGLRVLLGRAATWLTALQLAAILTFTAILSYSQPELLYDPWGRLTKNLPLAAMVAVLWLAEREGWTSRAVWLLRLGVAWVWLIDGAILKMYLARATPWTAFLLGHLPGLEDTPRNVRLVGALEVLVALVSCLPHLRWLPRGGAPLFALNAQIAALIGATLLGTIQEPLLWVHPFGPLTKNVSWLLGTVALLWFTPEELAHES
jgi:uncharacterized membrane protein YphA (DoxX/SURF4 family)